MAYCLKPALSVHSLAQPVIFMKKTLLFLSGLLAFSGAATVAFGASSSGLHQAGGPPDHGDGHSRHPRPAPPPRYYHHRPAPVYYGGYPARPWHPYWACYYPGYYWGTGYWGPSYGVSVVYDTGVSSPVNDGTYTAAGAVIGGVAGAIIGHNSGSHRNGWNTGSGAVVGAGLGAIAGSIADHNTDRDRRQQPDTRQIRQADRDVQPAPEAGRPSQNTAAVSNDQGGFGSMRPANALFGR